MTIQSLAKTQTRGEIIETILVKGDLAKLTADERNSYYLLVCESVGLNPLTRPLEYITLSGRLVLYARKDATDQLRSIHNISVTDLTESERDGVFIVTAKVQNGDGRTDIAKGAVNIANLKGEHLANAIMKTETKAKRRATLSICGLGLLDETEIEDSAGSVSPPPPPAKSNVPSPPKSRVPSPPSEPVQAAPYAFKAGTTAQWCNKMLDYIAAANTADEVVQWDELNRDNLKLLATKDPARLKTVMAAMKARREELTDHISRMPVQPREGLTGADEVVTADGEIVPAKAKGAPNAVEDPEGFLKWADKLMGSVKDPTALDEIYNSEIESRSTGMFPPDLTELAELHRKHELRLGVE